MRPSTPTIKNPVQMFMKGRQLFSKLSKVQYNQVDQIDVLLQALDTTIHDLTVQDIVADGASLFDLTNTLTQLFSVGLNRKESLQSMCIAIARTAHECPYLPIIDDSLFQTQLLDDSEDDAATYTFAQVFLRHLLANKHVTHFLRYAATLTDILEVTFYEADSGIIFNTQLRDSLSLALAKIEAAEKQMSISTDTRYYRQQSEENQLLLDRFEAMCIAFPEKTYSYSDESKMLQVEVNQLFEQFEILEMVDLLLDFNQKLAEILQGKGGVSSAFIQAINMTPQTSDYQTMQQQLAIFMQVMTDCGCKMNKLMINLKLQREICFGPYQYKVFFIRFFIANPLLFGFFLAHLGSTFDGSKPTGHTALLKAAKSVDTPLINTGFCTKLAISIIKNLNKKELINVTYIGAYHTQFFIEVFKKISNDRECGPIYTQSLIENIMSIFLEKIKKNKNVEVLTFFFLSILIEIKQNELGNLINWFRKSDFECKDQIMEQMDSDLSDDEMEYKLFYHLLAMKQLNQVFANDYILQSQIQRLEHLIQLDERYFNSQVIQKQRLLFIQVIYVSLTQSLQKVIKMIPQDCEPRQLADFIISLSNEATQLLAKIQIDSQYIIELRQKFEEEGDWIANNVVSILGLNLNENPQIIDQLSKILFDIKCEHKVEEHHIDKLYMFLQVFEQTGLYADTFLDVIDSELAIMQPEKKLLQKSFKKFQDRLNLKKINQVEEYQQSQEFKTLYKLFEAIQQLSDPMDRLEAFNRGLIITGGLNELIKLFLQNNLRLRTYYSSEAWIVCIQYLNHLNMILQGEDLQQYEFVGMAKRFHSSKPFVYEFEEIPVKTQEIVTEKIVENTAAAEVKIEEPVEEIIEKEVINEVKVEQISQQTNLMDFDLMNLINNGEPEKKDVPAPPVAEAKPEAKEESSDAQQIKVVEVQSEADKAEQARVKQVAAENERVRAAEEKLKREQEEEAKRIEAQRVEAVRVKNEQLRLEAERIEKAKKDEEKRLKEENERIQREKAAAELQRKEELRIEEEKRLAAEAAEAKRIFDEEQAEKARKLAEEHAEAERQRIEAERIEKERLEAERIEKERLEAERLEKEARDKAEAERLEKERLEKEKIEKERIRKEREQRAIEEKHRLEQARKQTLFVLEIPEQTEMPVKMLGMELNTASFYAIQFILANQDQIESVLQKGQAVSLNYKYLPGQMLEFFKQLPEAPFTAKDDYKCMSCQSPASICLRESKVVPLCANCCQPTDLDLFKTQKQATYGFFEKANVRTPALMVALPKAIEVQRIIKLYAESPCEILQQTLPQIVDLKQKLISLNQCLTTLEPGSVKLIPRVAQACDAFLAKSGEIIKYFNSNTHLPASNAFLNDLQNNTPLTVYGIALLYALAHADEHAECQVKTCPTCQKQITTFKYSFSRFEKLVTGNKAAVAMCSVCLRIGHTVCMTDGMCKDCKDAMDE